MGAARALPAPADPSPGGPPATAHSAAAASPVATLSFSPAPVAPAGSLAPGQLVTLWLSAQDLSGAPAGNATVYLAITSTAAVSGSASVGPHDLTGTPAPFFTDRDGRLAVSYVAANPQCSPSGVCIPGPFPVTGEDILTASVGSDGSGVSATDSYDYAPANGGGASPPDRYQFSPQPITGPAALAPGQAVPMTLTVATAGDVPEAGHHVFISLSGSGGGTLTAGGTSSSSGGGGAGCTATGIRATPVDCVTDSDGQVQLTYVAGGGAGGAATSGTDIVRAQNSAVGPTESADDSYDYSPPAYQFSASPIDPDGSLGSAQSATVALSVTDIAGRLLANCPVYLYLAHPGGGPPSGSAWATGAVATDQNPTGAPTVSDHGAVFETDANGRILVTYSTPQAPPSSGSDLLVADSSASHPAAQGFDDYVFSSPVFTFSPAPVAAPASLAAGASVTITLTSALARVYLAAPASDRGVFSIGPSALGAVPAPFDNPTGTLRLTYRAPESGPRTGEDRVVATDAAESPAHGSADVYSLAPGPSAPASTAYRLAASDGGVFTFGGASFEGSAGSLHLVRPVVGMATTPDGGGYWLVASDGGVFAYGDARFFGSRGGRPLAAAVVGMAATPDGEGYWLVASDGGVFAYGDARFFGSLGSLHLNSPVVAAVSTPDGAGYWLVAADGGVFSYGDARFFGSLGSLHLNSPVVGGATTSTGNGYWLVAGDGGVFCFGDAAFFGSGSGKGLSSPFVGLAATSNSAGYWLATAGGTVLAFGDAAVSATASPAHLAAPIVALTAG